MRLVVGYFTFYTALSAVTALSPLSQPPQSKNKNHQLLRRTFVGNSLATAAATATALVASSISSSSTGTTAATAMDLPATGKKAPPFELPNSRGDGTTSLSKLVKSGKWTILYFYPGAFTQGCTLEARYFQRDMDEYRQLDTQIVGVSVDPPEKNAQFCAAEGLDFYMLSDAGGRVSQLYGSALSVPGFGVFSNRQTYIIDPAGNLQYVFTDVESRIPRHSAEVLEKLKELKG